MTTSTANKEGTGKPEETVEGAGAPETDAAAEASFAAGYDKVRGGEKEVPAGDTSDTTESTTDDAPAAAGAKPDGQAQPAAGTPAATPPADDPWKDVPKVVRDVLEPLSGRLRSIEGHIGGLKSGMTELKSGLEVAKAATGAGRAAPSQTEIAGAAASSEKWNKLKEDFPEWAEAMEERLAAVGGSSVDAAALKREVTSDVDTRINQGIDKAEERAFVRLKYPDWRKTINTPEFAAWRKAQGPDSEINRLCASDLADDTIKVLDAFAVHSKKAADDVTKRRRQQQRLEGGVVPEGGSGSPPEVIDDEQALQRGYKKVAGKAAK